MHVIINFHCSYFNYLRLPLYTVAASISSTCTAVHEIADLIILVIFRVMKISICVLLYSGRITPEQERDTGRKTCDQVGRGEVVTVIFSATLFNFLSLHAEFVTGGGEGGEDGCDSNFARQRFLTFFLSMLN